MIQKKVVAYFFARNIFFCLDCKKMNFYFQDTAELGVISWIPTPYCTYIHVAIKVKC